MKASLKNRIRILSLLLRFSQVAQLLKETNFGQKLEKGPRPSSLTEIIRFIALASPFSSKLLQKFPFTKIYRKA